MKSFSQFIIEKKSEDIVPLKPDEAAKEKSLLRNKGKKGTLANQSGSTKGIDPKEVNRRLSASTTKGDQARSQYNTSGIQGDSNTGGNTPSRDLSNTPSKNPTSAPKNSNKVNPNNRPPTFAEVEASATQTPQGQKAQADAIKGGANNTPSTANKKNGVLDKLTKGAEKGRKRSIDGFKNLLDKVKDKGNRVPDQNKGELGKLYKSNSADDPNRAGSVRTNDKINQELTAKRQARIDPNTGKATKKGVENFAINQQTRGLSNKGDAGKKSLENAKKIASDSSSKAYKEIETKINNSDYAGKRANLASADELKQIKADIKTSKTINTRSAPLNVPNKIQTKTTKIPLNTSTRKGKIWNKVKEVIKRPTSTTSTKSTQASQVTRPTGKDLYTGGGKTPGGTNITTNISSNKTNIPKPETTKVSGGKTFKNFTNLSNKTSNAAKLKITPKNLAGRVTGPAFAAWNFADNWKAAKGSPLRKTVKSAFTTAAYYKGFAGGAALGTAGGSFTGPGAFVTGTAGGLMGGNLAQKTASSVFNKIWKPPTKTKIKTNNTNKSVVGGSTSDKLKKKYTFSGGVRLGSGADPK